MKSGELFPHEDCIFHEGFRVQDVPDDRESEESEEVAPEKEVHSVSRFCGEDTREGRLAWLEHVARLARSTVRLPLRLAVHGESGRGAMAARANNEASDNCELQSVNCKLAVTRPP